MKSQLAFLYIPVHNRRDSLPLISVCFNSERESYYNLR